MAVKRHFAQIWLWLPGFVLGLLLILFVSQSSGFLGERDGTLHVGPQAVVLHVAATRLTPAKADRLPNEPYRPAVLVPALIALPVAPRSNGLVLRPAPRFWCLQSPRSGWQARAPPILALHRFT